MASIYRVLFILVKDINPFFYPHNIPAVVLLFCLLDGKLMHRELNLFSRGNQITKDRSEARTQIS